MRIESQVVSLELSKKLKELDVKQESLWNWCQMEKPTKTLWDIRGNKFVDDYKTTYRILKHISAFTVAELGEMLPDKIKNYSLLTYKQDDGSWCCGYEDFMHAHKCWTEFEVKIEANARAKMLVYLIENKLCPTTK